MTGAGGTRPARPTVLRDRATWTTYVQVGLFGYFLYAFGPTIALLRDETGTSRAVASLHGTGLALGSIVVGLLAPYVVHRTGRGPMMRAGSVLAAAGLVVYVAGGALPVTLAGIFVAGLGGTLCLVGANAFMPEHQGPATPQAMAEMHSFGAVMGLLGPLAVGLGVALTWGWRPALLVGALGFVALELVRGRRVHDYDGRFGTEQHERERVPSTPLSRTFWLALATLFCAGGIEFSLTFWGSELLATRAGMGEAASAAAIATLVGGMAVGRVVGSRLLGHVDAEHALIGAFAVALVGFLVAWVSSTPVPMLLGFLVAGLGMSLQSPLGIGRIVAAAGRQVDRGSGLASATLGIATGLAPFVLGALADGAGIHTAFLVVPVLAVAAIVLVRVAPVRYAEQPLL